MLEDYFKAINEKIIHIIKNERHLYVFCLFYYYK